MSKRGGKDGVFQGLAGISPRAKSEGNPEEQAVPYGPTRLAKCHHQHHPGWCKMFRVWVKYVTEHMVFCCKFNLLSQFGNFFRGKCSWKCKECYKVILVQC